MLHIRLLDTFELLFDDGSPLSITSARQRELLVYLILRRKAAQARSQIAFVFWPDTSDKQAQRNLRAQLSRLRSQWSEIDRWLEIGNRTVQWRPDGPYTLDVAEFEHELAQARVARKADSTTAERDALQAAIGHYRGPLFPGVLEDWVLAERERLEQHYLQALERLVVLLEEQRSYGDAIAAAQRLLRHDPLRERTYRQLMRLYAVSGDRPLALRTYHTCVTILSRELEVKPDVETELLYQRLVQSDQEESRERQTGQRSRQNKLIGRQTEWQCLLAVWRQVLGGRPHFLVISGEAGIGKSRLAQELFEWTHRQGVATARTRAYAAEGSLAYSPVVEWLRSDTLRPTLRHLEPVWLVEVARLLPELRVEHPNLPEPVPLTDSWQRRRLFESLAQACTVDTQPRLLLLDDLQWCDEETLAWLRFFLRFEPGARVLIVGTMRPQEVGADHPVHGLLSDLRAEGQLTELMLNPLTLQESVTLAEQVVDHALEPTLHERLFAETAGNPLFVVETAKAGLAQWTANPHPDRPGIFLPPKIYAVIQSRLNRLSAHAQDLASLAATIGRSFTFAVLSAVSSLDEDRLVDVLDELWQGGIILEQGVDAYDFSHDRIRDVAYAQVSPVRRSHLHRTVARALEQIHARNLDGVAAQLAFHWSTGGNRERAIDYYEQAAGVAMDRLALSDVVTLLSACVALLEELPQTPTVQQRTLAVLLQMYRPLISTRGWSTLDTLPLCRRAQELSQVAGTPHQRFQATDALRSYHLMHGQQWAALNCAQQMVTLTQQFPGGPSAQELARAHSSMGNVLFRLGKQAAAQEHFALGDFDPPNPGSYYEVLVLWLRGYADQAQRKATNLPDLTLEVQPFYRAFWNLVLMQLSYCLREQEKLREHTEALLVVSEQYEMSFWQAASALFQGWSWVQSGEQQAGLARMEAGIKGMERTGAGVFTLFLSMLVAAYAQTGQFADALTTLKRAMDYADAGGEHFWYAELQRQMADLLQAQGSPTNEVETWYQRALKTARRQDALTLELRAAVGLCRLWLDCGHTQAAHDLLSSLYASLTEGFDTVDLIVARELLEQLA